MIRYMVLPLVLAVTPAFADEAAKTQKIEEFMRLAKLEDLMRQQMDIIKQQVDSSFMQELTGVELPPEVRAKTDQIGARVFQAMEKAMSWEKLQPEFTRLYAEAFTEPEIDGILAFYRSPAGEALVAKTPGLMMKAAEVSQKRIAEAMPEIRRLITESMEELVRDLPPPPQER